MKCAARLPLTAVPGLVPLPGYGDSRNMAAHIDSEQFRGERTLYRSSAGARAATVAPLPEVEFEARAVHEGDGRLTVAIHFNLSH